MQIKESYLESYDLEVSLQAFKSKLNVPLDTIP